MEVVNSSQSSSLLTDDGVKRFFYLLAVSSYPVVLPVVLTALVFLIVDFPEPPPALVNTEFAEVSTPEAKALVEGQFQFSGRILNNIAGHFLFIAEKKDGLYWPKKQINENASAWSETLQVSEGKGFKYSATVIAVDQQGRDGVYQWWESGASTGSYPGIAELDGLIEYASIRITRK